MIRTQLLQFSKQHEIPLYCFAESYATHGREWEYPLLIFIFDIEGAYFILSCGKEVYANYSSLVGNADESYADVDFSSMFSKYNI